MLPCQSTDRQFEPANALVDAPKQFAMGCQAVLHLCLSWVDGAQHDRDLFGAMLTHSISMICYKLCISLAPSFENASEATGPVFSVIRLPQASVIKLSRHICTKLVVGRFVTACVRTNITPSGSSNQYD